MSEIPARSRLGVILRVGVFVFLVLTGLVVFAWLMLPVAGLLATAALSTFAAAAVANAIAIRIWERAKLSDIGMGWTAASVRNLLLGVAGGMAAAAAVIAPPILAGTARWVAVPGEAFSWSSLAFVSGVLLFGAIGEELLFRGYAFQVLFDVLGPFATILPAGVLFGLAHSNNENFSALGLINTIGWGIILGLAFLRSGDLWLPIGLHFGWNWVLPLAGVNLSGFKMGITGYVLQWNSSPLWSGGAYGPEAALPTTLVLFALLYFLYRAPIHRQKPFVVRSWEE